MDDNLLFTMLISSASVPTPQTEVSSGLKSGIVLVKELLTNIDIRIPEYQRPYKWTAKHVNQLIDDVLHFKKKQAYRLGTIVFHENAANNQSTMDIVDGQQRTITLALLAKALLEDGRMSRLMSNLLNVQDRENLNQVWNNLKLSGEISRLNVVENYREITRRLVDFDDEALVFLFQRCELVGVVLSDISEAFQFFDSQNARGKDLDPPDLLKAYHLREMTDSTEVQRTRAVEHWEQYKMQDLLELFSLYLFRVRNWAKGREARYFTKSEIDAFKGVSPLMKERFPFSELYRIAHYFNDQYNADYVRQIDRNQVPFPFQLDQVMINGRRFFEFVDHYYNKHKRLEHLLKGNSYIALNENSRNILETINTYEGRNRTGDRYVFNLFQCALLFFTDKFGWDDIDRAIEKFFLWAYRIRLEYINVQLATVDTYAIGSSSSEQNIAMFRLIHEAVQPSEILNLRLEPVEKNNSRKTEEIFDVFKSLGYA
ncbi:MAG: DUF262 domain-containing protein [Bacteroidota bacterium]|jgi:hypothetical protein